MRPASYRSSHCEKGPRNPAEILTKEEGSCRAVYIALTADELRCIFFHRTARVLRLLADERCHASYAQKKP